MKVIDLLNKIANGEELPKKFVYVDKENVRYIFDIEEDKDYWCEELGNWFFSNFSIQTILNDELEIIEEDKEIEEIDKKMSKLQSEIDLLSNEIGSYHNKIHSMRDRNNYMKETLKDLQNELKKGKKI